MLKFYDQFPERAFIRYAYDHGKDTKNLVKPSIKISFLK